MSKYILPLLLATAFSAHAMEVPNSDEKILEVDDFQRLPLESQDFEYFYKKHETALKEASSSETSNDPYKIWGNWPLFTRRGEKLNLENLERSEKFETARAIFNYPPHLSAFREAVAATAQITDNSSEERITSTFAYWHWSKFLEMGVYEGIFKEKGYYNPLTNQRQARKDLPTLSLFILLGLCEIESYPCEQIVIKRLC